MERVRQIIDGRAGVASRSFDALVQTLIIVSLITFSVETLPDLSPSTRSFLSAVETTTVLAFSAEYLLRLAVAVRPAAYAFSFYGLVDLISILPFYLATGVDLRSVRVFRLLRLVRILKLARYSLAVRRFHRALLIAREELVLFLAVTLMLLFLSAVGIYYCERDVQPDAFASVFHSLWWAAVTLTTVGYGDVTPITVGGRAFTFAVLLVGLGVVSVPAGVMASALNEARRLEGR